MDQKMSRAQEKAKAFIQEHGVEKIISEMLNSLVHSRDPKPIIFMIKYLSNLVTEAELLEHGITVTGPAPQRIPIITYPKFDVSCDSLLKKHLTREIWANMKKKSTSLGGNIQLCVKSGVEMMNTKVGIMATDDEAYKTFGDLFAPVIKDLHPRYDHRFFYKFDEVRQDLITEHLAQLQLSVDKITNFRIEASRNFKGTPFAPLMTKESKLQVERRVVEILGDLYGKYHQVKKINEADVSWLKDHVGIDAFNKSPEHEAAGINDDWPVGRGIFIQDSRDFVVLVNYEDHLKFLIVPPGETSNLTQQQAQAWTFIDGLARLIKSLHTFEQLAYAVDQSLGNLTVSPQNLGTALSLEVTVTDDAVLSKEVSKEMIQNLREEHYIRYERVDGQNQYKMRTCATLASNYNELQQIKGFLKQLSVVQEYFKMK